MACATGRSRAVRRHTVLPEAGAGGLGVPDTSPGGQHVLMAGHQKDGGPDYGSDAHSPMYSEQSVHASCPIVSDIEFFAVTVSVPVPVIGPRTAVRLFGQAASDRRSAGVAKCRAHACSKN